MKEFLNDILFFFFVNLKDFNLCHDSMKNTHIEHVYQNLNLTYSLRLFYNR